MIEITSISAIRNNIYQITFDNKIKEKLYDETILKFSLTKGKLIEYSFINEIKKYNYAMIIFFKTQNLLIRKLYTKNEIEKKLSNQLEDKYLIDEVIYKLEKLNLINDSLYIKAYINDQINFSLNGPKKIKYSLIQKGINSNDIDNELENYEESFWDIRIKKIIEKRKKINTKYSNIVFKINTKKYLYNLGYITEMNINDIDDSKILKVEYNKLKNKNMDEKKIIQTLLNKGFIYEDIKKLENE